MPFDNVASDATIDAASDAVTNVGAEGEVTRFLRRAWALIDSPEKWIQGTLRLHHADRPEDDAYCTVGALERAGYDLEVVDDRWPRHIVKPYAMACLYDTLPRSARYVGYSRQDNLIGYNDTRHWRTIARWWRRAIDLAAKRDMLGRHQARVA